MKTPKNNEFKCELCGGIFGKGWSDEDAQQEYDNVFGYSDNIETSTVCDDCYNKIMPYSKQILAELTN